MLLNIVSYERWREIFGEIPRQRKENSVKTYQQRAALLLQVENGSDVNREQQEMCRYYCQEQGYQLSEQHIYQGERVPFDRDAPYLVQLRLDLIQKQFDVLVVPFAACLGVLPLWMSPPTASAISEVYRQQARIESAMKRHGVHDVYQQMLLDGIFLIKRLQAQRAKRRYS